MGRQRVCCLTPEITMDFRRPLRAWLGASSVLAVTLFSSAAAVADEHDRSVLVLTSTNGSSTNSGDVFKLDTEGTPSLSLHATLPTGGVGGAPAGGNAGMLQFKDDLGAVANFGSNTVSRLERVEDSIIVAGAVHLLPACVPPL